MKRATCYVCLGICLWLQGWAQSDWSTQFPPGKQGLDSLLQIVLEADPRTRYAITRDLFPSYEDCEWLFPDRSMASRVYQYQKYLRRHANIILGPLLAQQTHLLLWEATPETLLTYEGEARNFPGGYHELAEDFASDCVLYRLKFVEPGRKLGSAFDVMVYLNGHWRLIHRPWVVLLN